MTRTLLWLAALLYLALIVLALRPATDLEVARLFFVPPHRFLGQTPAGVAARYVAWALPFVLLLGAVLAWGAGRLGLAPAARVPGGRAVAAMVLTMAIGPGLAIHAGLKELSHRPRPVAVTEFGGTEAFRPFTRFDGACRHNCAFPSGETAAASWTLLPASLAPPPVRVAAMAAALLFTAAAAGWRMALGAHWLSDVLGAMLIVIVVMLAVSAMTRAVTRAGGAPEA